MAILHIDLRTSLVIFTLLAQQLHGQSGPPRLSSFFPSLRWNTPTPALHPSTRAKTFLPTLRTTKRRTMLPMLTTLPTRLPTTSTATKTTSATPSSTTTASTTPAATSSQTTPRDVTSTQWVVIMCAETYNETARGVETDAGTGSAEMYARSLVPDIAKVAGVNQSQLVRVSAGANPGNGILMVQFGVVDRHRTNAVEAVNNLRRRLLPDRGRSRRNTGTEAWLLRSTLDNRTITATGIYNWTDDGPCPSERCGLGSRCSWRPDVQFYCVYSYGDCTSTAATSTGSCAERVDCILPVAILVVVGIVLIVLVVVAVVVWYRRRQRDHDKQLMMVFSRSDSSNPVLDLQTIETQSVTGSQVSSMAPPRPPPPSVINDAARKPRNWTRLRFKRSRRHLDPVATDENGYPSATRSVVTVEPDAESTASDNSGLPIHRSMATIVDNEVLSY